MRAPWPRRVRRAAATGSASESTRAAAKEVEACADGYERPEIVGVSAGRPSSAGRGRPTAYLTSVLAIMVASTVAMARR